MIITLFDKNTELCHEWRKYFGDYRNVRIINCDLQDLEHHDFVVTAGNSFGAMSGGLDLAIRKRLGYELQDRLQMGIMHQFPYGIPVGHFLTLPLTQNDLCNTLIYAPTMRVPSIVSPYDIVYVMTVISDFAMRQNLKTADFAIPGLGTGSGQLSSTIAAIAMKSGYDSAKKISGALESNNLNALIKF